MRTGTARLQRGQASREASIRSNAGFRCVGIALPTIATETHNGKVTDGRDEMLLPKGCGNKTRRAQITEGGPSESGCLTSEARPKIPVCTMKVQATDARRPRVYLETYGCQMNIADSQTVTAVLRRAGYASADKPEDADVILLNTCAIREHAEERILGRLGDLARIKHRRPEIRQIGRAHV